LSYDSANSEGADSEAAATESSATSREEDDYAGGGFQVSRRVCVGAEKQNESERGIQRIFAVL
jgi:hypothetical protein